MTDADNSDNDAKEFIFEIASGWTKKRALSAWSKGFYEKLLSYDAARVEQERSMLEAFELMSRPA